MRVEIPRIDECPNWQQAEPVVRAAGERLGLGGLELASEEEAALVPFAGSPTIVVDGRDPFPSAETVTELACTVSPTTTGLRGGPSVELLVDVMRGQR